MAEGLQVIKRGVSNDIVHFLPKVKKVTFEEVYARKDAAAAAAKKEEAPAEEVKEEAPKQEEAEQKA